MMPTPPSESDVSVVEMANQGRGSDKQHTRWLYDAAYLSLWLFMALFLAFPVKLMRDGWQQMSWWLFGVSGPFVVLVVLDVGRRRGRLVEFWRERSFREMTIRTFLTGVPNLVVAILGAVWPQEYFGGLQWGMFVGLLTSKPYATLDHPWESNYKYWICWGALVGGVLLAIRLFVGGTTIAAIADAFTACLLYAAGLWLGLLVGNQVKAWIAALQPALSILQALRSPLTAFGVGYGCILVFFACCYSALWRLEGPESFGGVRPDAGFSVFLYFSLVTGATIGYGDIVPHSGLSRVIMAAEVFVAQAWTLVVFAAVAVQFSNPHYATKAPRKVEHDE